MILFCTSGLAVNAFTVYQPYILQYNGFTNTQSSDLIMLRSLFSFFAMFLTGRYYKIFSYRIGLCLSGLLAAVSFLCFGLSRTYLHYCVSAAILGVAFGFGTMIPITILLSRWFCRHRTLALGICSSSTGLSTLGIPSLLTAMIRQGGLARTFLWEAAAVVLLTVAALFLIGDPEKEACREEDGASAGETEQEKKLPARAWWLLIPILLLTGAVTSVGYSHLSMVMTSSGFSAETVARGIMVSGLALTVGKLLYGAVSEKTSVYCGNRIFGIAALAGLGLICLNGGRTAVIFAGLLLYGGGLAFTTVGLSAWCGELCTGTQYAATVRRFQIGYSAGTLLFSSFPGILADRAGGSYIPAFGCFFLCCGFVLFSIQRIIRKSSKQAEA